MYLCQYEDGENHVGRKPGGFQEQRTPATDTQDGVQPTTLES